MTLNIHTLMQNPRYDKTPHAVVQSITTLTTFVFAQITHDTV